MTERPEYLSEQLITCIGNKRALLGFIGEALDIVKAELGRDKLVLADLFSGSGAVSRYFKAHAEHLHVNDLEPYCRTLSRCFLASEAAARRCGLEERFNALSDRLEQGPMLPGFITELYAPADDGCIAPGERAFYTRRNALYLDTARQLLEGESEQVKTFLLGPLLAQASVHTNTGGVFKGFYKDKQTGLGMFGGSAGNALNRILAPIRLELPVLSAFDCPVTVYGTDANRVAGRLPDLDLAYLDPPYNQHPYGSNYFMLNLLNDYERPEKISPVSGIPADWNRSPYNKRAEARAALEDLCRSLPAKYLLVSFSDDGFLTRQDLLDILEPLGNVRVLEQEYNTYRACRNLRGRDIHVKELLYLVGPIG